jgi:cell division protein FtsB
MAVRRRKKRSLTRFIAPLATMMILGYFGFHAFNGQYGIRAHLAMELRMAELEKKLEERTAVRNQLEARVAMLNDGTMEKDMVDQYVRSQLNMAREDEVVLLLD